MHIPVVLVLFVAFPLVYLLPAMVAVLRSHRNSTAITVMTVIIGWTVAGWVAALIWSLTSNVGTKESPANKFAASVIILLVAALLYFVAAIELF